jgi:hypothetical protein
MALKRNGHSTAQFRNSHEVRVWQTSPVDLDDAMLEKMNQDTTARPMLIKRKTQLLFGGMGHVDENYVLNLNKKIHSVTVEIVARHFPD